MFEAKALVKAYRGCQVVKGVSLQVGPGEVVGLLGPNGAGKTTTFSMMVGLIPPDRGEVLLHGEVVTDLPMYQRARKGMGYLPQEASIFRNMTVEENILAILETLPISSAERKGRLQGLLQEFGVAHLATHQADTLSGGERRRLEIARALVTSPQILLLDEPFAGMDPIVVLEIQKIIARLKQRKIGILITDHNVSETLAITDRAYIIYQGEILLSGIASDIARSPQAREVYLGERFRWHEDSKVSS